MLLLWRSRGERFRVLLPLVAMASGWVLSALLGAWVVTGRVVAGVDSLVAHTTFHATLKVTAFFLAVFIVSFPVPPPRSLVEPVREQWVNATTRRAVVLMRIQFVALVAALASMITVTILISGSEREWLTAMTQGVTEGAPVGSPLIALFFMPENVFMMVIFGAVALWAWGHRRVAGVSRSLKWALTVAGAGSAAIAAGASLLFLSGLIRLLGVVPPGLLPLVGMAGLAVGSLVVMTAVIVPMFIGFGWAVLMVCRELYDTYELRPLWDELKSVTPTPRSPWRTAPGIRNGQPDGTETVVEPGIRKADGDDRGMA
ncbi:hypothetical protein [Pseudonocardia sp. ICBG601]|uniref:hypothetical protein n=1 Tax=Pseudonocardia sp. ICBG601 TaxID=2846759 RepID=UPI001CF7080C|nr:hypothetical protein [Pseudonocardia sp. ICBG601]